MILQGDLATVYIDSQKLNEKKNKTVCCVEVNCFDLIDNLKC